MSTGTIAAKAAAGSTSSRSAPITAPRNDIGASRRSVGP